MSTTSITSASYPMPKHQLPPAAAQRVQHFGSHLAQLKANGVPKSGLSPAGAAGAGKNLAGVTAQPLLNSTN